MYDYRDVYPIINDLDDDLVCRKYRLTLEDAGFVWAPEDVARDFAFECVRPSPDSRHFGFHAAFNFKHVLDHDKLLERARLMSRSPYLKRTGHIWKSFSDANPEIMYELETENVPRRWTVAGASLCQGSGVPALRPLEPGQNPMAARAD
jgi:hypothetical protein